MATADGDFEADDGGVDLGGTSALSASSSSPRGRRRKGKLVFIDKSELPEDYDGPTVKLTRLEPVLKAGKVVGQKSVEEEGVTVTIVPLSPEEELDAAERADGNGVKAQYEYVKASMRKFNGKPIDFGMFQQNDIFEAIGMRGRNILAAGFKRLANATAEGVAKLDYFFRDEEV